MKDVNGSPIIGGFSLNNKSYVDERQGLAETLTDLKNWEMLVPDGFEVYVNQKWYSYDSHNSVDNTTGKFRERKGGDGSSNSNIFLDGGGVDSVYGGISNYDCGEI